MSSLSMESMNETRKKTYRLEKGDAIDVSVDFVAGELVKFRSDKVEEIISYLTIDSLVA